MTIHSAQKLKSKTMYYALKLKELLICFIVPTMPYRQKVCGECKVAFIDDNTGEDVTKRCHGNTAQGL